jgi:ZIP family zinc transporter
MDHGLKLAFLGSLLAGLATGLGALPCLFVARIRQSIQDAMLGFGAGVMLSATAFSLIIPALEVSHNIFMVALGIAFGAVFLFVSDLIIPHEHFIKGPEGSNPGRLRKVWLFVLAITLHNFPEGLAVGVGFKGGNLQDGIALATGIGIQNIPEGLVVALALRTQGYSRLYAVLVSTLTGLVEPVGGIFGGGLLLVASTLLPFALSFAGGAMLFVVSDEIIPESHRTGHEKHATFGVVIGFIIMMLLDNLF